MVYLTRDAEEIENGVTNPVTCIDQGTTIMFSISKDNYPKYNPNSLYNSNKDFDESAFREMEWVFYYIVESYPMSRFNCQLYLYSPAN